MLEMITDLFALENSHLLLEFGIRIIVAVLCGFIIGFERQWTRHPAGIITNVLVAMGSTLFTSFSFTGVEIADQTRIAAQVVTGIGFLGAGVIMRQGLNIRGLNTAATIWCSSAIGVLCANGSLARPLFGTAIILGVNVMFRPIAEHIVQKRTGCKDGMDADSEKLYVIRITASENSEYHIRSLMMQMIASERTSLRHIDSTDVEGEKVKIKATISSDENEEAEIERMVTRISVEEGVVSAGWKLLQS